MIISPHRELMTISDSKLVLADSFDVNSIYRFDAPWPAWITIFLMVVLGYFAVQIYLSEAGTSSKKLKWTLALIRLITILLIVVMLYGPRKQFFKTELPHLMLLVDNSKSMSTLEDTDVKSPQSRLDVCKSLLSGGLIDELAERYRLNVTDLDGPFADSGDITKLKARIAGIQSNVEKSPLGNRLVEIQKMARSKNAAAIILFTDGITTDGPLMSVACQDRIKTPVFCVAPKKMSPAKDIRIDQLEYQPTAYLGDLITFQFQLIATGFDEMPVTVRLRRLDNQEVVSSNVVEIAGATSQMPIELNASPMTAGSISYRIELEPLDGEKDIENNSRIAEVNILDEVLDVLLVQNAPSYEFRFLRSAISRYKFVIGEASDNAGVVPSDAGQWSPVRLQTVLQESDLDVSQTDSEIQPLLPDDGFSQFDLIIFGDVDPSQTSHDSLKEIVRFVKEDGRGIVFIAGPQFTPNAFWDSPLVELFPFHASQQDSNVGDAESVESVWHLEPTRLGDMYRPLQFHKDVKINHDLWRSLAVPWHLHPSDLKPGVRVMAHLTDAGSREIVSESDRATDRVRPAITLHYVGRGKVVFHFVDALYQMRARGNENRLAEFWLRTIRFLSQQNLQTDKDVSIRVFPNPPAPNSPLRLVVDFADDRMAPEKDDALTGTLQAESGRTRSIQFQRSSHRGQFSGIVNDLRSGHCKVWIGESGSPLAVTEFNIGELDLEAEQLQPDRTELQKVADSTGGKLFECQAIEQLKDALPRGDRVRIGLPSEKPIWNSPIIAVVLLTLLSSEWILRRAAGMM